LDTISSVLINGTKPHLCYQISSTSPVLRLKYKTLLELVLQLPVWTMLNQFRWLENLVRDNNHPGFMIKLHSALIENNIKLWTVILAFCFLAFYLCQSNKRSANEFEKYMRRIHAKQMRWKIDRAFTDVGLLKHWFTIWWAGKMRRWSCASDFFSNLILPSAESLIALLTIYLMNFTTISDCIFVKRAHNGR